MLGAIYLFFVTREATIGQLLLSFLLAILAPILFLIIQTMAATYRDDNSGGWRLLASAARDFWKLLVIALPLILLAVLAAYLFGKFEPSAPATAIREAVRSAPAPPRPIAPKPQPVHWQSILITTLEYLLFCLVLPLAAIHLWIATARDGLKQTFKQSVRIIGRAFAPQSVVIYVIGFVLFAVVPYFLIVTKTPVNSAWLDAGLLVVRLLLAVLFSLIGWVVTVGALAPRDEEPVVASVDELKECHYPA
jgi:MFS family permease